jgi:MEMO1 family protein
VIKMGIREPVVAGMFYPKSKTELDKMIEKFFAQCNKIESKSSKLRALIVPHAGYVYSGIVAASGYSLLQGKKFERIIILGPSHALSFLGAAFDTHSNWMTPLGSVTVSNFIAKNIRLLPQAHQAEHSIEVQIPFIQKVLKKSSICPIALGLSPNITDDLLSILDEKTFLIVSSDLSHYLSYDEARKVDNETIKRICNLENVDFESACGAEGINILLHIAKKKAWKPQVLDFKNSGDTAGSKMQVVGYCCVGFYEQNNKN